MLLSLLALLVAALPTLASRRTPRRRKRATVRLASLNVLGASHTDSPGGKKFRTSWWRSARRVGVVISIIRANPCDVWALQECQPSQRRAIMAVLGHRYACHYSVDNVLLTDRRRWKRIETGFVTIPYFGGQPRKMPWAVLEGRKGGRRIAARCTHDPAFAHNAKHRVTARERAAEWGKRMAARPRMRAVFDLGDMNANRSYRDHVERLGAVPAGQPSIWGIDWIVKWGDKGKWLGFRTATSARLRRATDHPLVMARAEI